MSYTLPMNDLRNEEHMSHSVRVCVIVFAFLLAQSVARGEALPQAPSDPVGSADVALGSGDYSGAVRACADALMRSPDDSSAQTCAPKVRPYLAEVVVRARARLGSGDLQGAFDRCAAVLVLDPGDKEAASCASTARLQLVAHERDRLRLEQARVLVAAGDRERAEASLAELSKSEFPDILQAAIALHDQFERGGPEAIDRTQRAAIARARLLVEHGKQDEAIGLLEEVLASSASAAVRDEAVRALSDARPSLTRSFRESLRNPWVVQLLAVLLVIAGLWVALHWARDLWRWIDRRFISGSSGRSWTFTGVKGDDPMAARDPILDALRRVPHEVRKPIWTPTRLLLYPHQGSWEVWEDFCISPERKVEDVHEDVFKPRVNHADGDKLLREAFENLQFSVGNIGAGSVTKFWTGLVAWWRTGEPSFSAMCQEVTPPDGSKKLVIRLTSTGPAGTASVLASTDRQHALDAVSLVAERAAYKLLFTMSKHEDSAAQIDGHAAFRQGVTTLGRSVRPVPEAALEERKADLLKAIRNLEVARRSFERDRDHEVYHLQSLRFLGVAHALVGAEEAARSIFEELEDLADKPPAKAVNEEAAKLRNHQLKVEARFNQAVLYCSSVAHTRGEGGAALALADALMQSVAKAEESLEPSVRVWSLFHRTNISWQEWRSLDRAGIADEIVKAQPLPAQLDALAAKAVSSDRRHNALLAAHARRYIGLARLRFLAAFELNDRQPFRKLVDIPDATLDEVRNACNFIDSSALLGPLPPGASLIRAYGLLLQKRWYEAEEAARAVLSADRSDQFAMYVAGEAALQRGARDAAFEFVRSARESIVVDRELCSLITYLGPDLDRKVASDGKTHSASAEEAA